MLIYGSMFLIVCLLTKVAQVLFEKEKKNWGILVSIIIIIIPSIIAGVRDTSIGTDVEKYVGTDFYYATQSDSIIDYCMNSKEEPLYSVINFIVSRFTTDVHWLLFVIQLIMTFLVYITLYRHREKIPMWIGMAVFFAFIYPRFLNLIRQGIATCIVIFSIEYVEKKKFGKFSIAIIIATLFHRTAIAASLIYLIYYLLDKNNKISRRLLIITYISLGLSIFFYDDFLRLLLQFGVLPDKFEAYLSVYKKENIDLSIFPTIYKTIWLLLGILTYQKIEKKDKNTKFYLHLLIVDLILVQFSVKIDNAERISFYYGFIGHLFLIPQLLYGFKNDKLNRNFAKALIISLLVFYFWWCFIHYPAGEIYPYASKILGI